MASKSAAARKRWRQRARARKAALSEQRTELREHVKQQQRQQVTAFPVTYPNSIVIVGAHAQQEQHVLARAPLAIAHRLHYNNSTAVATEAAVQAAEADARSGCAIVSAHTPSRTVIGRATPSQRRVGSQTATPAATHVTPTTTHAPSTSTSTSMSMSMSTPAGGSWADAARRGAAQEQRTPRDASTTSASTPRRQGQQQQQQQQQQRHQPQLIPPSAAQRTPGVSTPRRQAPPPPPPPRTPATPGGARDDHDGELEASIELIDARTGARLPTVQPSLVAVWPEQEFFVRVHVSRMPREWDGVQSKLQVDGETLNYSKRARAPAPTDLVFDGFPVSSDPPVNAAFRVAHAHVDDGSGAADRALSDVPRNAVLRARAEHVGTIRVMLRRCVRLMLTESNRGRPPGVEQPPPCAVVSVRRLPAEEEKKKPSGAEVGSAVGAVGGTEHERPHYNGGTAPRHAVRPTIVPTGDVVLVSAIRFETPAILRLRGQLPADHPVAIELSRREADASREEQLRREQLDAQRAAEAARDAARLATKRDVLVLCDLTGADDAAPMWSESKRVHRAGADVVLIDVPPAATQVAAAAAAAAAKAGGASEPGASLAADAHTAAALFVPLEPASESRDTPDASWHLTATDGLHDLTSSDVSDAELADHDAERAAALV